MFLGKKGESKLFELSALLNFGFVPGLIGLNSQAFHLTGEVYEALFLWSFLTLPLAWFGRSKLLIHLWIPLQFAAWFGLFENNHSEYRYGLYFLFVMTPFILIYLAQLFSSAKNVFHENIIMALRIWSGVFLLIGFTGFSLENMLPDKEPTALLAAFNIILPFISITTGLILRSGTSILTRAAIIFAALNFSLIALPAMDRLGSEEIFDSLFFILAALSIAILFLSIGLTGYFEFVMTIAGIRFLIVYFQVFGDMALTGFGLILSGLIIAGSGYLWYKYKERSAGWIRSIL